VHDLQRASASCETGYWIHREAGGQGYAGEACAATISWAMKPAGEGGLGLRRVRVICSGANHRSVRVIEKLGLPKELHQRQENHLPGVGLTDRLGWGVMAHEWDTTRHGMRE
jgi:RimJ/RimL family protein N-acetyltransferase